MGGSGVEPVQGASGQVGDMEFKHPDLKAPGDAESPAAVVARNMEFAHPDFKAEAGGATVEALDAELGATNKSLMEVVMHKNDVLENQMARMIGPRGEVLVFIEPVEHVDANGRRVRYGVNDRMGPVLVDDRVAQLAFKDTKRPFSELYSAAGMARNAQSEPVIQRLRAVREEELPDWKASYDQAEKDAMGRVFESRKRAISVSKGALDFVRGDTNVSMPPPPSIAR